MLINSIEREKLRLELIKYPNNSNFELLFSDLLDVTLYDIGFSFEEINEIYHTFPYIAPISMNFEYIVSLDGVTFANGYRVGDVLQYSYKLASTSVDTVIRGNESVNYHSAYSTDITSGVNIIGSPLEYTSVYSSTITQGASIYGEVVSYILIYIDLNPIIFIIKVLNLDIPRFVILLNGLSTVLQGNLRILMPVYQPVTNIKGLGNGGLINISSQNRSTRVLTLREILNKIQFEDVCLGHLGCDCRVL